ncbi:DUF1993 domain-containing protein [Bradyrhizobium sp. AZCC 1693]|uniref:DUF1993 domain-containing protein n=1 Tax=Bradyrhizobium sp. AZCC 1693 TaxID=3117029 RepID=UPI002FF139F1
MSDAVLKRTTEIFTTRLQVLAGLLDAAETQWREKAGDPETFLAARLADDMFPFPHQIAFACNQPNRFAAWCIDAAAPETDPATLDFAGLKRHVWDTVAYLAERTATADDRVLDREKRIDLSGGRFISLTGPLYVDEWLLPNFYFHLVTGYDILRHEGRAGSGNLHSAISGVSA